MKGYISFITIFLIFILAGCSELENTSPVFPEKNSPSLSKVHPVPFKVTFSAVAQITPTSPTSATSLLESTGNGTHIGKFSSISNEELHFTSPTTADVVNGTHTVYTANGDEMYATFSGTVVILPDGISVGTINLIFNGGTGRFEDLYGEIQAVVTSVEPETGQLVQNYTGEGSGFIIY